MRDGQISVVVKDGSFRAIGQTPERNLDWFLRFIQQDDLGTLTLGDSVSSLRRFCVVQGARAGEGFEFSGSAGDLVNLALTVRGGIERLLKGEEWRMHAPRDLFHVMKWDRSKVRPAQSYFKSRTLMTTSLWRVRQLLGAYLHRIGRCQACNKFFLIRKRAKFCSPQCGQKIRSAAFIKRLKRQKPEKLKERRQVAYLRRLRETNQEAVNHYLARVERADRKKANRLREQVMKPIERRRPRPATTTTTGR
jgi:hypothetical protein